MLKIIAGIIGIVLLVPIALALVIMIVATLIGGYVSIVLSMWWEILLVILAVIVGIKLYKRYLK